jgi:hypothetical protein
VLEASAATCCDVFNLLAQAKKNRRKPLTLQQFIAFKSQEIRAKRLKEGGQEPETNLREGIFETDAQGSALL